MFGPLLDVLSEAMVDGVGEAAMCGEGATRGRERRGRVDVCPKYPQKREASGKQRVRVFVLCMCMYSPQSEDPSKAQPRSTASP